MIIAIKYMVCDFAKILAIKRMPPIIQETAPIL
jgi:hypothetical protein